VVRELQQRRLDDLAFARPDISEADVTAVLDVLRSGWITTGTKVREFEAAFAQRVGTSHAIAVNSATAALHLALDAIGLQCGDEVIVPTITFAANAEVVRYFDAIPILVDVEAETLCIDPAAIERAITPRTRAIMPVHLAGYPADMDSIIALARQYGLQVVEDAAHTLPSFYHGKHVGTIGQLGAFSFYATKTITTGEGGMLVTDDNGFAERARIMSLHGMSRDAWKRYTVGGNWRYDVVAPGYKYNLTDLAAALGLSQLGRADQLWERRRAIADRYTAAFESCPELQVPTVSADVVHSWHLYILRLQLDRLTITRDCFMEELRVLRIMTSVHFIPLHTFTYYRTTYGYHDADFPIACAEFERMVSLPIYPAMTDRDVDDVIDAVLYTVESHRA
jgi:dTDP-4-amino-4,6-dideoxygalactose transaminase